ncbi:NACHT domain-containing protein [Tunturiibacter lichenicola]|uniref:NACHT domain-containing protein n=1 Tax=Tunturiibacter lichenicola TaxID=2051959 RepID=UPI0021B1DA38|nr:NACHT domain-containing protein [Edaphobacter lichenicola]
MEPLALILTSAKVVKAIHDFAFDETKALSKSAAQHGVQNIIQRLKPSDREKAIKSAIKHFAEAWYSELEDTVTLTAALPGYQDQLANLIEAAPIEIGEWMDPEVGDIDLGPIERIWRGVKDPEVELPKDFDWKQVALKYKRSLKRQFRDDPALRGIYETVLQERSLEVLERAAVATERIAGPVIVFSTETYKKFLVEKKCNSLQLSTLDISGYTVDRKVSLWNVFVPQSARGSAPILGVPPEILREMLEEGEIEQNGDEIDTKELIKRYQSVPIRPILEILSTGSKEGHHVVVTGDPGAGKSSLLKYLCLRWATESSGPTPVLVDLKEYGKSLGGIVAFCQSCLTMPRFNKAELDSWLKTGAAALYLDGLDEVFSPQIRYAVIGEIATLSSEYPKAQIIVTSRKVGYQPERLANAGFTHANIEDFSQLQIEEFLNKWHGLAEDDENKSLRLKERLMRAITDNRSIRELAGNPLLLTMMSILNRSQELPRNRVSLYQKASEVLLHDWDADRALSTENTLDRDDKRKLLLDLAGEMQQAKASLAGNLIEKERVVACFKKSLDQLEIHDSRASAIALVRQLEERNFILASAGAGRFSFVHRTFLEFFCAAWFVERLSHKEGTDLFLSLEQLKRDVFLQHWKDEKWREVLRLITGMVHETKADELIKLVIEQDDTEHRAANLILAAGCLSDVRARKALRETDQILWQRLTTEARKITTPEADTEESDSRTDARAEAVRALAHTWRTESLGWLKENGEDGPTSILRVTAIEVYARGWKDDPETLAWLKVQAETNTEENACGKAVEEIGSGWRTESSTLDWLREIAVNSGKTASRQAAIQALATNWRNQEGVRDLIIERAALDDNMTVRSIACLFIGIVWQHDPVVFPTLRQRFSIETDDTLRYLILITIFATNKEAPQLQEFFREVAAGPKSDAQRFAENHLKQIDSSASAIADSQDLSDSGRKEGAESTVRRRHPNPESA